MLTVAGSSVASAAPSDRVLILGSSVTGGTSSVEAQEVVALGLTPVVADDATWTAMSTADFATYRALVIGDPTCESTPPLAAVSTTSVWGPAVSGNILINGTDPVFHASQGGAELTQRTIDYAVADSTKTGLYVSLSCYYHDTAPHTAVPLLDAIQPGGFTVTGVGCYNTAHIVATHPALDRLTDDTLSNWSCSVHEAFDAWPPGFTVLALAQDFGAAYTASDGTIGTPYILAAGGGLKSFPLSVTPAIQDRAVGDQATITAQLLDSGTKAPVVGQKLSARVYSGPSAGTSLSCSPSDCLTSNDGRVAFTFTGRGTGTDAFQVWVDTNGDGSPTAGEAQTTASVAWKTSSGSGVIVSFGDSIAAGEGSGPHSGYPNNAAAYSARIASRLGWSSYNFAISGACAATSGKGGVWGTPSECTKSIIADQIPAAAAMNLKPSLVTVTVGANDIRFADCIQQVLGLASSSPCSGKTFDDHLQALKLNLGMALAKIRDLYGSDVPIVVTRYFSPMPGYVSDAKDVCPTMPALALAKVYTEKGAKAAVWAVRDLNNRARDYQASVSDKTLAVVGKLNNTLTKTATPFKATMVGLNFSGHDFCTDYDGRSDSWVLAPQVSVFASYYGAGGASFERELRPAHRCVVTPSCDTNTMFVDKSGDWNGQHWTFILSFWSNDFPHLTKPGHEAVASRIIEALSLQ
ncbi:GDSL-type esterase/lipase family protein [Micromonospora chersina]|nr:GDSL-type esterase/lipase family protein [Micromonospora chersina]